MENLKIEKWLTINFGYGYGRGSGDGSGSGNCYGYGYGYGYGRGNGSGDGHGSGYGYGFGDGSGNCYCYGYGFGDGSGHGSGFRDFNGMSVYRIDRVPTIITNIKRNLAKGFIINSDFSLSGCYIVKGRGYFAHGATVNEARQALLEKILTNMDTDETIDKFTKSFVDGVLYSAKHFYEWHHYLTGSCEMGRKTFMKDHGISMDDKLTVNDFIKLCEDSYGGDIIKQLKERYEK